MRVDVRPYVTAGVALVGAGVIAVTPISAPPPESPVAHPAVQLAAIPSPLQLYPQVFLQSATNAGALLQQYFADPFPIVTATLENQSAAFAEAVAALEVGDFDGFASAAADIVLEPFKSAGAAAAHLGAILTQPFAIEGYFLIAISPVLSGLVATGKAVAEVFDALTDLDLVGVVNAVINIPARIIDGVLNGVPGASFGILENLPGLLTPADPESDLPPGPIAVGISLDQDMGAAIPPRESSVAIDEVPDPDAKTFTVAVDTVTVDAGSATDPEADVETIAEDDQSEADALAGEDVVVAEPDETDDTETVDTTESDSTTTDSAAETDRDVSTAEGNGSVSGADADKDAA